MSIALKLISILAVTCCMLPQPTQGHVRLWEPPGRSTMWRRGFQTPINYQDNELNCGGLERQKSLGYRCGLCGDPYDGKRENEAGGTYATGVISRTYTQGQTVSFQLDVTANHKGYFEFKLCPTNDPKVKETQECFDNYPLKLADGSGTKYYIPTTNSMMTVNLVLPFHLTCKQCVLQFRYHAGNNWGTNSDGTSCVGCGLQEEFYSCSDIAILSSGSSNNIQGTTIPDSSSAKIVSDGGQAKTIPKDKSVSSGKIIINTVRGTNSNYENKVEVFPANVANCRGVGRSGLDEWCQNNCQMGHCPPSHCTCDSTGGNPGGNTNHDNTNHDNANRDNTNLDNRSFGGNCVGVGAYAKVPGMSNWCDQNCAAGHCPPSHCRC